MDISVIITAHKDSQYLIECLNSVKKECQNFKGTTEIILAFDGSYDDEFITKWLPNVDLVTVTGKLSNLANNFNIAVFNAKGKYIKIVAYDDLLRYGSLTELFKIAENNLSDVVYADFISFDGSIKQRYTTPVNDYADIIQLVLARKVSCGTSLFNRESFNKVGGFDTDFNIAEGFILFVKMLSKGINKFNYCNHVTLSYRIHNEQKSLRDTSIKRIEREQQMVNICNKYNIK